MSREERERKGMEGESYSKNKEQTPTQTHRWHFCFHCVNCFHCFHCVSCFHCFVNCFGDSFCREYMSSRYHLLPRYMVSDQCLDHREGHLQQWLLWLSDSRLSGRWHLVGLLALVSKKEATQATQTQATPKINHFSFSLHRSDLELWCLRLDESCVRCCCCCRICWSCLFWKTASHVLLWATWELYWFYC